MRNRVVAIVAFVVLLLVGAALVAQAPESEPQAPDPSRRPPTIEPSIALLEVCAPEGQLCLIPQLGEAVSFVVVLPKLAGNVDPRIQISCYQDDVLVYGTAGPYYQAFLLGGGSSDWLNDPARAVLPATCVADLYYWSYRGSQRFNWLASTEFVAEGV